MKPETSWGTKVEQVLLDTQGQPIAGVIGEPYGDYVPPSWDVYFMRLAYEVATKSKDPSTKFGAVIVRDKRPILFGYNGLPPKVQDYSERLNTGAKYPWIVHAETNAIACGAKYGIATNDSTLFVGAWPCSTCAGIVTAAGITEIVLHRPAVEIFAQDPKWNNTIPQEMFAEAGIRVRFLDLFIGRPAYISRKKYNL
jgi:dCMP deaminase